VEFNSVQRAGIIQREAEGHKAHKCSVRRFYWLEKPRDKHLANGTPVTWFLQPIKSPNGILMGLMASSSLYLIYAL
jgi:hypothetical protein